jgi:hypothetical protein
MLDFSILVILLSIFARCARFRGLREKGFREVREVDTKVELRRDTPELFRLICPLCLGLIEPPLALRTISTLNAGPIEALG